MAPAACVREGTRASRPARVLVVDDDVLVARALARVLRRSGYDVVVCDRGEQALESIAVHPPDAILTDVLMPGMNGVELLVAVSACLPNAVKVLVSGCAIFSDGEGLADFAVNKPWDDHDLLERLDAALQQRRERS